MNFNAKFLALVLFIGLGACTSSNKSVAPELDPVNFESTIGGKHTNLYTIENSNGMKVQFTNYGARIASIIVPDKEGNLADVIQGFNTLDGYKDNEYNALIGPFANRIANGEFSIGDETYHLSTNDNGNCLHNGAIGSKHSVYDVSQNGNSITMTRKSKDGEFGFPGNKTISVVYTLTDSNELKLDYYATTDKACPFNLTNHAYFNLKGESEGTILDHIMFIDADSTTNINNELIPTGEIVSINGTDLDFTVPTVIGNRIDSDMEAMVLAGGYDHNYILNKDQNDNAMTLAARVIEPTSGRVLEVFTTEPAIQFYSGNFQDGTLLGKGGKPYTRRSGFCLETQHYPDSPNHANFPNTILQPEKKLHSTTIYKFSVQE